MLFVRLTWSLFWWVVVVVGRDGWLVVVVVGRGRCLAGLMALCLVVVGGML